MARLPMRRTALAPTLQPATLPGAQAAASTASSTLPLYREGSRRCVTEQAWPHTYKTLFSTAAQGPGLALGLQLADIRLETGQ